MHPMVALFKRNAWANEQLLDFCARQPADLISAPAEEDLLGGIDAQFTHLVAAEVGFLRWITGRRREEPLDTDKPLALDQLRAPMRWVVEEWPGALDFDRDPELVREVQRRSGPTAMTDWLAVLQYLHHGDDHRAQIGTQLGRHDVEGPELDLWAYFEAEGSHPEGAGDGVRTRRDSLLRRGFGHHEWATTELLTRCLALSADELALTAPGTFGSILDTLDHTISSNRSYLSRLKGKGRLPRLNAGGITPLQEHFRRTSEEWLAYLDAGPDFEEEIDMSDGTKVPAWVIVAQALHHGNDHRTHVTTVLMHHGLEAPSLSPWAYSRSLEAPQVTA
ncbi:MAG TPA: DinB family protein [Candidatus Dormibacteraeota bacterium]|nr:DinB family protein [Candidatus Dormibacteraeota bacterium]